MMQTRPSAPTENPQISLQELWQRFRPSLLLGAVLFVSGLCHLIWLITTGAGWSGPLSLRKPALFGISAGLTVWSLAWTISQLKPRSHDRAFASFLSGGLLIEVALITVQQWRSVPSHFNHATTLDAIIEFCMLALILLVTAGIAWICLRSSQLRPMSESLALAIRAGLWLLLVSCGLGVMTTILGEVNIARGLSPEVWGAAGILKYPHGAAMHAIQTLPLLSISLQWAGVSRALAIVRLAIAAHVLLLIHAAWQTLSGRARLDVDRAGLLALVAAALILWVLCRIRNRSILTAKQI